MILELEALVPMVQALGWTLLHFLWQGLAIGAFFWLASAALRRATPHARYLLGLVCMGCMGLAPVATFLVAYPSLTETPVVNPIVNFVIVGETVGARPAYASIVEMGLPWVVLLWMVGVAVMSGRVLVNWVRMRRCLTLGTHPICERLRERAQVLTHLFGIRRAVRILESSRVLVPTMLGWLRPVVLLPTSSLIGLPPGQLELVIAHELAHVRRYDYLVNCLQVVIETVLFYHPVVRWVSRAIRDEREKCCDDLVIASCGNRLKYVKALASLEIMRPAHATLALAATDGQLLQRIERIVCARGDRKEATGGNPVVLMLLVVAAILVGRMADPVVTMDRRDEPLLNTIIGELTVNARKLAPIPIPTAQELESPASSSVSAPLDIRESSRFDPKPLVNDTVVAPVVPISALPESAPLVARERSELSLPLVPELETQTHSQSPTATPTSIDTRQVAQTSSSQSESQVYTERSVAPRQEPMLKAIRVVNPEYPNRARRYGLEGWVTVEFSVKSNGRVKDVKVVDSVPSRVFDGAARRAIRGWRFAPTRQDLAGQRFSQTFDFTLVKDDDLCKVSTGSKICRPGTPTAQTETDERIDEQPISEVLHLERAARGPAGVVWADRLIAKKPLSGHLCYRPMGSRICLQYFLSADT